MLQDNHQPFTIRRLLSMLRSRAGKNHDATDQAVRRTPTARQLRNADEQITTSPDGSIAVYASGYAICETTAGTVVLDLRQCENGYRADYACGSDGVSSTFYLDPETTDWHWVAMMFAEDQAGRNQRHRKADRLGVGISIDAELDDAWETEAVHPQDTPQELLERQETIAAAMSVLTDRQKLIATLYHLEGKTQAEIADFLGISQAAVHCSLEAAKKRWRKMHEEI